MSTLLGMNIVVSTVLPDFVQNVKMAPCGCSDHVLKEMNGWLLERFGQRRQILKVGATHLVMSPGNYQYMKRLALGCQCSQYNSEAFVLERFLRGPMWGCGDHSRQK